jgi:uncharacterized protein YaaQ
MQLVLAIVHDEDASRVIDALIAAKYRVTHIHTVGGFFKRPNSTLLIGVEPERVADVISHIKKNCTPREEPRPVKDGIPMYAATIFVLEAKDFLRV